MRAGKCVERIERMRAIEREHDVATLANDVFLEVLGQDSALLQRHGLSQSDFKTLKSNLEITFLIRLFAEFETGLKDYWKNGMQKNPKARIVNVIGSIASRRKIPDPARLNAHAVRRFRNMLVHEEDSDAESVEIRSARGYLCRFFGHLPED